METLTIFRSFDAGLRNVSQVAIGIQWAEGGGGAFSKDFTPGKDHHGLEPLLVNRVTLSQYNI